MDRQKIFNFALKTFLFLSPLFFFKGYKVSFARGMFFILGSFVLFALSLGCEQKRKFSNLWVSLFLLLAFVRIFFDNPLPNLEWFNFWISCAKFIYVFAGVLLFYTAYCYAEEPEKYIRIVVWVCVLNAILTTAQLLHKDFMWENTPSICGFMETSSQLGQYSALALPLLIFIHPILGLFPAFTLLVANSYSSILASLAGMAFLGGFKGRILTFKVGIGILLILWFSLNFSPIKDKFKCRPILWQKTLKISLQRPYLGWGYGSFKEKVTEFKGETLGKWEYSRAHNDYLHTAQELGFPILCCVGIFFWQLLKKFKTLKKDKLTLYLGSSILVVLINMSGQTLIRYAGIAGTFVILLAFLCIRLEA
jgi:hypothetical protein